MSTQPVSTPHLYDFNFELDEAVRAARGSMQHFLHALRHPEPHQTSFQLRVAFAVDNGVQDAWLGDIEQLEGHLPTGIILSQSRLAGFAPGTRVPFETVRVTDWMYSDDNELIGGFTARALLKLRMRDSAQAERDSPSSYTLQ